MRLTTSLLIAYVDALLCYLQVTVKSGGRENLHGAWTFLLPDVFASDRVWMGYGEDRGHGGAESPSWPLTTLIFSTYVATGGDQVGACLRHCT